MGGQSLTKAQHKIATRHGVISCCSCFHLIGACDEGNPICALTQRCDFSEVIEKKQEGQFYRQRTAHPGELAHEARLARRAMPDSPNFPRQEDRAVWSLG